MQRRTVLILLLTAVLLTLCSAALSQRDSEQWSLNRTRRLLPFSWQDTVAIHIQRPDGRLVFRKDPHNGWQVQIDEELFDTLNPSAVEELAALATLTWREPQANRKPPTTGEGITLTAISNSGQKVDLTLGEVAHNLRAVRIDDDQSTVYGINQDLLRFLDWPQQRFRTFMLFNPGSGRQPSKITIEPDTSTPSLTLVMEKKHNQWQLLEPVSWPVDETRLDMLLRWIDRLRAETVTAEMTSDLEWFGFSPPKAYVEVEYDTPEGKLRRKVEFGNSDATGTLLARDVDRAPIFSVTQQALSEISMDVAKDHPVQWRNFYRLRGLNIVGDNIPVTIEIEQLLPVAAKLSLRLNIDQNGSYWEGTLESKGNIRTFAVDPPDSNDPMRPLTALFTGLANLRIKTFLIASPPGEDTAELTSHPAWRITQRLADGTKLPTLTIFAANTRGELPSGVPYSSGILGAQELTPLANMPEKVGFAFSVGDKPAIMETFGEMSYLFCLPPYRYQTRKLLEIDPRAFVKIRLRNTHGEVAYFRRQDEINEQWWHNPDQPEPLMDGNNTFVATVLELSQLKAEGFVADGNGDIVNFGLDQPEITAIVYTETKQADTKNTGNVLFTLSLGKQADGDGSRFAQLNNSGPIFVVSARLSKALSELYQ